MPVLDKSGIVKNPQNIEFIITTNDFNMHSKDFAEYEIIGVEFPSHADGRGFSIARKIRTSGFSGTLRAIGPIIPDQFADLLACGFDEIEIPEEQLKRQSYSQFASALSSYSLSYQRQNSRAQSIISLRHGAKNGI